MADALTFGSLFAGIGGFDLGLERAGMVCRWQVENDGPCNQVLARHWPDVPRYEDVRDVGRRNLEPVDVVCGGFPCQDLSVAGKREGLAGERSGLWFQFHRVLAELRPRWTVIENVPGLLSSSGGADFAVLLRGLVELGYGVCWRVLDAQYAGVPQRRRRVFIVGHLGDGRAAQVLFEREGGAWDPPPSREKRETTTALTGSGPGANGGADDNAAQGRQLVADPLTPKPYADNEAQHRRLVVAQCHGTNVGPMGTLRQGNGNLTGGVPFVAFDRTQAEGVNDGKADVQCVAVSFRGRDDGISAECEEDVSPSLRSSQGGSDKQFVAYGVSENQRAEVLLTDYSHQITSGGGKPGQGYPCIAFDRGQGDPNCDGKDLSYLLDAQASLGTCGAFGVRRLAPTECCRLQNFPDDWNATGVDDDGQPVEISDTQRYRQMENAVCEAEAEWLGHRILEADRGPH